MQIIIHKESGENSEGQQSCFSFPLSLLSLLSLYIIFILFSGTFTFTCTLRRDSSVKASSRIEVRSVTHEPFVKNGMVHTLHGKLVRSVRISQLIEAPLMLEGFLPEARCFTQKDFEVSFEIAQNFERC